MTNVGRTEPRSPIEEQLYETIVRLDSTVWHHSDRERQVRDADVIMRTVVAPALEQARRDAIEEVAVAINEERPAVRYQDKDGDMWVRADPFLYVLVGPDSDNTSGAIFARPLKYVRDTYGPLTPVTDETGEKIGRQNDFE